MGSFIRLPIRKSLWQELARTVSKPLKLLSPLLVESIELPELP